jgi:hypothetical protein
MLFSGQAENSPLMFAVSVEQAQSPIIAAAKTIKFSLFISLFWVF